MKDKRLRANQMCSPSTSPLLKMPCFKIKNTWTGAREWNLWRLSIPAKRSHLSTFSLLFKIVFKFFFLRIQTHFPPFHTLYTNRIDSKQCLQLPVTIRYWPSNWMNLERWPDPTVVQLLRSGDWDLMRQWSRRRAQLQGRWIGNLLVVASIPVQALLLMWVLAFNYFVIS